MEPIDSDRITIVMMRFRHFLLCLMMLALPMQGFAAASMLFCGMGASNNANAGQTEIVSNHHHAADSSKLQHAHSAHGKTAPSAKQSADSQKQLPDASHKCGVCAACCSALAISNFPRTVAAQSSPQADLAEPFLLIYAVPSRLPDKPPRV